MVYIVVSQTTQSVMVNIVMGTDNTVSHGKYSGVTDNTVSHGIYNGVTDNTVSHGIYSDGHRQHSQSW